MTDRELLEAAAKAAGMAVLWDHYAGPGDDGAMVTVDGYVWVPLLDDGDALRLAVKLSIDIRPSMADGSRFRYAWLGGRTFAGDASEDPYAATRRAIVRAAAAIGKTP